MSRPPVIYQRTYVTLAAADLRKTYIRDTIVVDDTGAGIGDVPLQMPKIGTAYAPVGLRTTIVKASNATHAVAVTPDPLDAISSGVPGAFPDFGAPGAANDIALPSGLAGSVMLEATDMALVGSAQPNPSGGTPTTAGAWLALGSGTGGSGGGGGGGGLQSLIAGAGISITDPSGPSPIIDAVVPPLGAVLQAGNQSGPFDILLDPGQQLDVDAPGTLLLGTTTATAVAMGGAVGSTGSPRLLLNQGGTALHGSNAGIQVASAIANRGAIRVNQYGNNSGVPGITGFKSRGLTVGDLVSVSVDDVLWRATGIGVCDDDVSIPLAGMISLNAEFVATGYVACRFAVQAVPADGPNFAARREVFAVTSQGIPQLQENTNRGAGLVTLGADGSFTVLNTNADGIESRYTLTVQEGTGFVPAGRIYISAHVDGVSFRIKSTAGGADQGVVVYWQMWGACAPGAISP